MTTTAKNIIPRKLVEVVQTAQYTAHGGRTIIDKFTVTNTTSSDALFSCNLVANGDSPGAQNLVINQVTVKAGSTYMCPELVGQILEDGGFISTLANVAAALTLSASGREVVA